MFRGQRGEDSRSLRIQRYPQGSWQKDDDKVLRAKKTRLNFSPTGGGPPRKADDSGGLDTADDALAEGHPPSQIPGGVPVDPDQGDQARPQGRSRGWRNGKGFRRGFGKGKGKGKFKGKGKGKKRW